MRHYYRCPDCLYVWAQEKRFADLECGGCDARAEWLGEVFRERLVHRTTRAACDGRCLNAKGPCCDCNCEGANHGAGLVLLTEVRDVGGVPRTVPLDRVKSRAIAAEYRAAYAKAQAVFEARWAPWLHDYNTGRWVNSTDAYWGIVEGKRALTEARASRVHWKRLVRLAELAGRWDAARQVQEGGGDQI